MSLTVTRTAPVFRSFDEGKARAFYVDWLDFTWEGEHRFHPGAPLYAFLRLGDFYLHLSEHHGDCTPGSTACVTVGGLRAWHAAILARPYPNNRPGLEQMPWGLQVTLSDPFGNRLRFVDPSGTAV